MAKAPPKLIDALEDLRLTLAQRAVLAIIAEETRLDSEFEVTIEELAETLKQHRNSASTHLNALLAVGYVDRRLEMLPKPHTWKISPWGLRL